MILYSLTFTATLCCAEIIINGQNPESKEDGVTVTSVLDVSPPRPNRRIPRPGIRSPSPPKTLKRRRKVFIVRHEKTNWYGARDYCESKNMQLATISNQKEQEELISTIKKEAPRAMRVWIGLNNLAQKNVFTWIEGTSPTYTNWSPNQPANHRGKGSCVFVLKSQRYRWNEHHCDSNLRYVCQNVKKLKRKSKFKIN